MQLNWGNFGDTWKDSWKTLGISGEIWGDPKQTWGDQGPERIQANITTFTVSSLSSYNIQTTEAMGLERLGRPG